MMNDGVENKVTWDTGCLAEDFWFAFNVRVLTISIIHLLANLEYLNEQAARCGFKFGWIQAIAREQPPVSVLDLIQQRRPRYTGIMSMDSWLVRLVLAIPMMGPLAMQVCK